MRIVGGSHKGRSLTSPKGLSTRPTSDKARGAVFNVLAHAKWRAEDVLDGAAVLDVFAGTGAMGLEALSRGGAQAVFIERDAAAITACQENIDKLDEGARAVLMRRDALTLPVRPPYLAPRTLVFLDPPYSKDLGVAALSRLVDKDWLAEKAVIVMEMSKKQPEPLPAGFKQHDERPYGIALVRFLERE